MSGTRSPSKAAPATEPVRSPEDEARFAARWPVWKLGVLLYPFSAAAVAINLFMLSLMWQRLGWPAIPPVTAVWISVLLGVPATWAAGRWVRHLIDEAEGW
ncbi:hypothetical protein [Pseudothioclava nitratireducens]|jgi:hypothetical protein|uniref:hypothetical protein n=1 Tax=Pseudothioclava nitratireducens TaxID=1928646 RepID=UPI0023DAC896|nr:hypothetical protein [Defluviimonas nitratireducens]MDF1618901.1 hypothetical protein [Defluviimonas nitratireducens]